MFRKRRRQDKTQRVWGTGTPESPDYWLVWIPDGPASASETDRAQALCVTAPQFVRRDRFDDDVDLVLKAADAAAYDTGYRVLFFSEATRWLIGTGRTWEQADVDWEAALKQLNRAALVHLRVDPLTYAVAADASAPGAIVFFDDGQVQINDTHRAAARAQVQKMLEDAWPRFVRQSHG